MRKNKGDTLANQVFNVLRDSIVTLRLKPGERLNELALIGKLGVSRSPLREAFRLLEGEGLITRRSHKGVFVREINVNDIVELFPIRAALEGLAAELAAPRLTEKELKDLERVTEDMEEAVRSKDIKRYLRLNFGFHRGIVKGARNKRLEEMIKSLGRQSMWFVFASLYYNKSLEYAMSSHKNVFDALKKRDARLASELLTDHIKDGARKILDVYPWIPRSSSVRENHLNQEEPRGMSNAYRIQGV